MITIDHIGSTSIPDLVAKPIIDIQISVSAFEPMEPYREDRLGYSEAKRAFIWKIIQKADRWAQDTGWEPGPSDA
jgi:GrpB-like predicted nucleotidyltransferase (UPF0157 family)